MKENRQKVSFMIIHSLIIYYIVYDKEEMKIWKIQWKWKRTVVAESMERKASNYFVI